MKFVGLDKLLTDFFVDGKVILHRIKLVLLLGWPRLQFFHHLLSHIHARDEVTATSMYKSLLGGTYLYIIEVDDILLLDELIGTS